MAALVTRRVITEAHEVIADPDSKGPTIGMQIDTILSNAARKGDTISEIAFHIEPDEWNQTFGKQIAADNRMSDRAECVEEYTRIQSRKAR